MLARLLVVAALVAAPVAAPAAAMSVTKHIPGADGSWDYASVDAAGSRLLVSRGDGVMTVDLATGAVTATFVPGAKVHAAFIIPGMGIGVSTNGITNSATLFDAAGGKVRAEIKTGLKPDAATWDAATGTVWVMNAGDGAATIIDPAMGKAVGAMTIGGGLEFAVTDGAGRLYVNVEDRNQLVTIDTRSRAIVRRTALTGCNGPTGLALTRQAILIAACANGVAKTVDAASGKLLADIPIGAHPDAVIYDAARHRAYIPAGGDGTLTVIETSGPAPTAIGKVAIGRGARTGAVDPATGVVYLPTAHYADDGTAKPKPMPGSFEVLVVTP